jgi:hypothetical protein
MNRYDYMDSRIKNVIANAKDGNIKAALLEAKSVLPELSIAEERDYCDRLIQRFSTGQKRMVDEGDPLVVRLTALYEDYWRDSMLGEECDHERKSELLESLKVNFLECRDAGDEDGVFARLSGLLEEHGRHSLFGDTIPYGDMLIWKSQRDEKRHVELIDSAVDVSVRRLSDFESLGWMGYGTLNLLYIGGWASGGTINAIMPAWEGIDEEFFDIRLIAHESQHCSDYLRFPGMTPTDLEYRAKLTEIYYAKAIKPAVMKLFMAEANGEGKGPHAKANFKLFDEMKKRVDIETCVANDGYDLIDNAAYGMFIESTREMKAATASRAP